MTSQSAALNGSVPDFLNTEGYREAVKNSHILFHREIAEAGQSETALHSDPLCMIWPASRLHVSFVQEKGEKTDKLILPSRHSEVSKKRGKGLFMSTIFTFEAREGGIRRAQASDKRTTRRLTHSYFAIF